MKWVKERVSLSSRKTSGAIVQFSPPTELGAWGNCAAKAQWQKSLIEARVPIDANQTD